ncbi:MULTISPECIES: hypothetical protein [Actinomyces]|uniref:Uncharacterized protein n=2 Tax=Actinomyces TaxID=1654 RepID=A0A853ELA7_9ACTO|nr:MULTISPECIES: hypothetical protein [Actinomyces]MBF0696453.1 hypothetical protein [Actinomyces bowdenii]NYS68626.1 hypothetical protein [Actinomyces bowdenii]BDA65151.1 hypothetical protein MANAM107_19850 [Actinomyces capricornis]
MNTALTATDNGPLSRPASHGPVARDQAERELLAAHAELDSLGTEVSPSRLERALERLAAAEHLLALAA